MAMWGWLAETDLEMEALERALQRPPPERRLNDDHQNPPTHEMLPDEKE